MRTYELSLVADSCSSVEEHVGDRVDEVKLCARDAPTGVRLGATWKLRGKLIEHASSFEVGRDKGPRLSVTLI